MEGTGDDGDAWTVSERPSDTDKLIQDSHGFSHSEEKQRPNTTFEERLQQFYLQLAEGKTGGMVACVDEMQGIVDARRRREAEKSILGNTDGGDGSDPSAHTSVYEEMLNDCRRKAGEATLDRLRRLCQRKGNGGVGIMGEGLDEDSLGDEETVIISYHAALLGKAESAANIYGGFLRNKLKQANDAAVKKLSSLRALHRLNLASGGGVGVSGGSTGGGIASSTGGPAGSGSFGRDDNDADNPGQGVASADPHPHITALATVLGEASKLMARLADSNLGQDVEEPVARLLHQDSKMQTVKILEWFQHDADLPKWQAQVSGSSNAAANRRSSRNSPVASAPTSGSGISRAFGLTNAITGRGGAGPSAVDTEAGGGLSGGRISGAPFDARGMDFIIDEMALACQYCQRYLDFVEDSVGLTEDHASEFFAQIRVVEGAYVQLEDAYCLRSVEEAMRIAEPIEVQDGTYVSSMVEDASFLVHKSLRRSVSTRSEQAIMAVCNRVTEILDPHAPEPSFYSGLATEADHRVPVVEAAGNDGDDIHKEPDDFSTALAKALDEAADAELGDGEKGNGNADSRAARSGFGGVEEAMVGINSVHVALSSVSAIQDALDRFLEANNPLVRLMLDEVARILAAYQELRDSRLNDVLEALLPPVTKALVNAFASASYMLGPPEYELRSADLPGARRLLQAATQAMAGGGEAESVEGIGGGCQAALLQEPFEELVRRLAVRVATGVVTAVRAKGTQGGRSGGGRTGGGNGGGFTEWGALLLRKEVRTLQQGLAAMMETDSLNNEFGEINELVHLLNFERPSDIYEYRLPPPSAGTEEGLDRKSLSPQEVKEVLLLRAEFQREAIDALEL